MTTANPRAAEAGNPPPVGEGETPSTDNQLLGQVLTAYEGLVKTGNTTDYINNATAGMQASAIIPGFQSLIDGTMTPQGIRRIHSGSVREGSQVTLALTGRSVLPFFPLRLVPSHRAHDVVCDVRFPVHTKPAKRGDNHGFP